MARLDRRTLLLSGLALSIDLPPGIAGTGEPADPLPAALRDDPRLARPVTLRFKRNPLSEVLADLQRQTVARLEAAREVADEPATIFVNDRPARDVMAQLAALFQYRWRPRGERSPARYELYQDAPARQEEQRLLAQEWDQLWESFRGWIKRHEQLARRPPEELIKEAAALQAMIDADEQRSRRLPIEEQVRRQDRVWEDRERHLTALRSMTDPHQRALVTLATSFTRSQWDTLLAAEPIIFSSLREPGRLPLPPAVELVLRSQPPAWRLPGEPPLPNIPQLDGQRQYAKDLVEQWRRAEGFRVVAKLRRGYREARSTLWFGLSAGAVLPKKRGSTLCERALSISESNQPDPPTPDVSPEEAVQDPVLAARRRLDLGRKVDNASNDWWDDWLHAVLPALAKSYSLNLVADGYRVPFSPPPKDRSGQELSLYEALNHYVLPEARWCRDGAFVRVRRHRWYDVRRTEVPARVAKQWADYLRARPSLTLDETAAWIDGFSEDQLWGCFALVMQEQGIRLPEVMDPQPNTSARWPRGLLRAYAVFPDELKRRLKAGEPVPFAALPPAPRERLRRALREQMSDPMASNPYGTEVPPTLEELAAGALQLALIELQREVRPDTYGPSAHYRITAVTGEARRGDKPLRPDDILLAPGVESPPPGGQSVHAVQFRYRLPDERGADFTFVLPWVQRLPERQREKEPDRDVPPR
jgi:hypothetical protein